jgi:hypothetical protein
MGDNVDIGRVQSKYDASGLEGTAPAPGPEYQVSAGTEQAGRVGDRHADSCWETRQCLSSGCALIRAWVDLPPQWALLQLLHAVVT